MGQAIALARRGWGQVSPNPMVGAVVVRDGAVVGEGWHARFGEAHAEPAALAAAGTAARGATLYVSLEPCAHHGKTPPCTEAVIRAGISRVVIASRDENPVAAGGVDALQHAGIQVDVGTGADEARELNAAYFHALRSARPWVTLKMAVSLDAAIADGSHTTSQVTGPEARRYAHWLRAGHDAVAVGMGTVHIDDPRLTVREAPAPRVPPVRIVFSRNGRLSLASNLVTSRHEGPVWVTAEEVDPEYEHALGDFGVDVIAGNDLGAMLVRLRERGIRSLLVEGGASLAAAFLDAGVVDRLVLLQAPVVFGRGALGAFSACSPRRASAAPRYRVLAREFLGEDLATTYAVGNS